MYMHNNKLLIQCLRNYKIILSADVARFHELSSLLTRHPSFHAVEESLTSIYFTSKKSEPKCIRIRDHPARMTNIRAIKFTSLLTNESPSLTRKISSENY